MERKIGEIFTCDGKTYQVMHVMVVVFCMTIVSQLKNL